MERLADIEAIKNLKYQYFRLLDQKRIDDLGQLLAADCTVHYHNGRYGSPDRESTLDFLRKNMCRQTLLTQHHGHHPEIEFTGDDTATGTWYLHDIVLDLDAGTRLEGAGFYEDRYRKIDGQWRFTHTGYRRTYEVSTPMGEAHVFNGFVEDGPFE